MLPKGHIEPDESAEQAARREVLEETGVEAAVCDSLDLVEFKAPRGTVQAQFFLVETDRLRSWWAQQPRRNPAGLGVTGEMQASRPADAQNWAQAANGTWRKGLSFPSWDRAVQAHLAHLLCYTTGTAPARPC